MVDNVLALVDERNEGTNYTTRLFYLYLW